MAFNDNIAEVRGGGETLADVRIMAKALKQRWPLAPEQREQIITRLVKVVNEGLDRDAVRAAQALISADRINQADEHHADPQQQTVIHEHEHNHTITPESRRLLVARAAERLAISGHADQNAGGEANSDPGRTVESSPAEPECRGDADSPDGAAE